MVWPRSPSVRAVAAPVGSGDGAGITGATTAVGVGSALRLNWLEEDAAPVDDTARGGGEAAGITVGRTDLVFGTGCVSHAVRLNTRMAATTAESTGECARGISDPFSCGPRGTGSSTASDAGRE